MMCSLVALLLVAGTRSNLLAAPVTELVIKGGDVTPDRDGTFDTATLPCLNNCGSAAFDARLNKTPTAEASLPQPYFALFLGNASGLTQVARITDKAPGGVSGDTFLTFGPFDGPSVNDSGQLLFISRVSRNDLYSYCLFRSQPLTRLFNKGQAAPGGNGTVSLANNNLALAFNQTGVGAFVASLAGTTGGATDDSTIYRVSKPGALIQIVREGQNVPEGNGKFGQIVPPGGVLPILNESGQVTFRADLTNTSGGSSDNSGVYRGDGNKLTKIARAGQSVPSSGTLLNFCCNASPDMNDSGEVVFRSQNNYAGFFKYAVLKGSGGALTEIARVGQTIPGSTDTFYDLWGYPRINKAGQVAFPAKIKLSSGTGSGIFRGPGAGSLITVARDGQNAPGGGKFSNNFIADSIPGRPSFCLNNAGQVAFTAGVDLDPTNNTPDEDPGIFFFNGTTVSKVVRLSDSPATLFGQSFAGTKFTELLLAGTTSNSQTGGVAPAERSGLNEAGQVAYRFQVDDGRKGIAIWSPTLNLLCASSRKIHSFNKTFDIGLPLTGTLGVECRSSSFASGGTHDNFTLLLRFTNKLRSVGSASVTSGVGSVSGTPTINGNTMTVNLAGVTNAQKIIVTVNNVIDAYGRTLASAKVPIGILFGDIDGNRTVDNKDVSAIKVGAAISQTTFRQDVNIDGSITQQDANATKSYVGTHH
jgi:hypothetical protein